MLLLCSGEDSYRALEKARELEAAFRKKHDPSGQATERLSSGKEGVEALLVSAAGGSLFSPRRFFRVDGLISNCPKNRQDALLKVLARDVDQTIIVTLEEGAMTEKLLKPYTTLQKFIHYTFAPLSPTAFLQWATEYAKNKGISDISAVRSIANIALGDSWVFVNELDKWRAGAPLAESGFSTPTIYDVIDKLLARRQNRWTALRSFDDANAVVASVMTQARALLLVRSGQAGSVHPYVAQKLARLQTPDPADVYARLATAFSWSRTGRANAEEVLDIFG